MKSRSSLVLVAVFICFSYAAALPAGGQEKNDFGSIVASFPGYHLLTLKERDSDTRAYILQHFPKANTNVVHADFDGDGHLDYAMLLKNDKSPATKLVVLLCAGEGQCRSVYELDVASYAEVVYLRPVAAGSSVSQTEAVGTVNRSSVVRLKSTAIQVNYFEKGTVVLYWNKKLNKIEEVQTED